MLLLLYSGGDCASAVFQTINQNWGVHAAWSFSIDVTMIHSDNPPSVIQQLSVVGGADTLKKVMASIFQDRKCIQLATTVVTHSYTFLPFITDASDPGDQVVIAFTCA